MMIRKNLNRVFSLLVALCLTVALCSAAALASEAESDVAMDLPLLDEGFSAPHGTVFQGYLFDEERL